VTTVRPVLDTLDPARTPKFSAVLKAIVGSAADADAALSPHAAIATIASAKDVRFMAARC
jgi:hypothetical protein